MCVIIVKPVGALMPTESEIRAAAQCHPDGFGIVTPTKFYKGLSLASFMRVAAQVRIDEPCIMHFRFATHGSVCRANCHPFKRDDIWFAHNGILDIKPYKGKTDSETMFDEVLYPIARVYGLESDEMRYAVQAVIGSSKFAFMQGNHIKTFGHFEKHEGRLYSNTRHFWCMYRAKAI